MENNLWREKHRLHKLIGVKLTRIPQIGFALIHGVPFFLNAFLIRFPRLAVFAL